MGRSRILAAAVLGAALAAACRPPEPPPPAPPEPAAVHRARLWREGGLYLQIRTDRLRSAMPSLGEITTLAATPAFAGAACLVDLTWSSDLMTVFVESDGHLDVPAGGAALLEGPALVPDQVLPWADCVLASLGSGRGTRRVPLEDGTDASPPAAGSADGGGPPPILEFTVGTGRWSALGLAPLQDGLWAAVGSAGLPAWARLLSGAEPPAAPPAAPFADRVLSADVQLVWLDPAAVAELLATSSAGLGPALPPQDLEGLALGLWFEESTRVELVVSTRGRESAEAAAEALRTMLTVAELSTSVSAAQLGADFGPDLQARAEDVLALVKLAVIRTEGSLAIGALELTRGELQLVQAFALALVSREFRE